MRGKNGLVVGGENWPRVRGAREDNLHGEQLRPAKSTLVRKRLLIGEKIANHISREIPRIIDGGGV